MAKQLVGKAPLSLVRTSGGAMVYVYGGSPVPEGADRDDVKRLLEGGFLVEVPADEVPAVEQVVAPGDDPGLVNAGHVDDAPAVVGERPARAAVKDAWVDYAVAQRGADVDEAAAREQAEGLTKAELVDRYGAD